MGRQAFTQVWVSAVATAAALVLAVTAFAGSGGVTAGSVTYTAAAGEVNQITVSVVGGNLHIADTSGVTALPGCVNTGTDLDCGPLSSLTGPMTIDAGDGNDSVVIDSSVNSTIPGITISGGTGNDTLVNDSNRVVTFVPGPG